MPRTTLGTAPDRWDASRDFEADLRRALREQAARAAATAAQQPPAAQDVPLAPAAAAGGAAAAADADEGATELMDGDLGSLASLDPIQPHADADGVAAPAPAPAAAPAATALAAAAPNPRAGPPLVPVRRRRRGREVLRNVRPTHRPFARSHPHFLQADAPPASPRAQNLQGVTKPAMYGPCLSPSAARFASPDADCSAEAVGAVRRRRLARRGGVKRMSGLIYVRSAPCPALLCSSRRLWGLTTAVLPPPPRRRKRRGAWCASVACGHAQRRSHRRMRPCSHAAPPSPQLKTFLSNIIADAVVYAGGSFTCPPRSFHLQPRPVFKRADASAPARRARQAQDDHGPRRLLRAQAPRV